MGSDAIKPTNTHLIVDGGRFDHIYGGGNGQLEHGAHVHGTSTTDIHGGLINSLYGGSNSYGIIDDIVLNIDNPDDGCEELILDAHGGGNESDGGGSTITIGCGTKFRRFYAGSSNADIHGDVNVTINGGVFDEFFGGNNAGGTIYGNVTVTYHAGKINRLFGGSNGWKENNGNNITGKITVNVYSIDDLCPTNNINYVFGAGKMAEYTPGLVNGKTINSPEVNIYKGTINNEVYGGGMGAKDGNNVFRDARVTSNPVVNIGPAYVKENAGVHTVEYNDVVIGKPVSDITPDLEGRRDVSRNGNVYGGGNGSPTYGNTKVSILNNSHVHGGVYGGGNAALVTGNTDVQIGD